MKKDIEMPEVFGVYIAVVSEEGVGGEKIWNAYIVNDKSEPIENVFVSSKGYLKNLKGEESKSSTLRHFYKVVSAKSSQKIEVIIDDVLKLNNEYFVSFYHKNKLFDKKFVFLPETIKQENISVVPIIQKQGIWIK
ncbi:MAG: hypothetical protein CMD20_03880 [Flavobacteriales bacterium]|nr:hypothetical protein [Flavobacteriales bacterium]|tara:strand:- start:1122 stop:1529 length:408 start_codon:yes stop_codon:yes gene_type:complete